MFERYTEKARRTIFFARYEASQFGSPYIEAEHLLLGLLREDKTLAHRLLGSQAPVESIRKRIEARTEVREKLSVSVDLPLSQECKRAMAYGADEAQLLEHEHIGTGHLLLGLLREGKCFAAQLLREQELTLDSVRMDVRQSFLGRPTAFAGLDEWLTELEALGGIWTVKYRRAAPKTYVAIYAGEALILCIEVIREERFAQIERRCDDHLAEGVAQIWLLEPDSKRAYTVTKTDGLREFKGEVLEIVEPPLRMDLMRIFA